jgi:hypothetical protein
MIEVVDGKRSTPNEVQLLGVGPDQRRKQLKAGNLDTAERLAGRGLRNDVGEELWIATNRTALEFSQGRVKIAERFAKSLWQARMLLWS